jgi:hypothetical protein
MTEYGCSLGDLSTELFEVHRDDSFTFGRGHSLHSLFFGHLQTTLAEQVPRLVRAWDATVSAGDRILSLLNLGVNAAFRMWSSQDTLDIEVFINDASAEFNNWELDMRGGVFLIGVRQYARALQGKTEYRFAHSVLDDQQHQSEAYEDYIRSTASAPDRPMAVYLSYKHLALFRFGHQNAAIKLGEELVASEMNDRLM